MAQHRDQMNKPGRGNYVSSYKDSELPAGDYSSFDQEGDYNNNSDELPLCYLDNPEDPHRLARFLTYQAVHILLVGETGAGKSTVARQIARDRAQHLLGETIVLDPHAVQPSDGRPGDWEPFKAIGAGRDFKAIAEELKRLYYQLDHRFDNRKEGQTTFLSKSIFIDEWPSIRYGCGKDVTYPFISSFCREGRKIGMRLVVLSQSDRLETLGLKGEGDTLENFIRLYLGNAARAAAGRLVDGFRYPLVIKRSGKDKKDKFYVFDVPRIKDAMEVQGGTSSEHGVDEPNQDGGLE